MSRLPAHVSGSCSIGKEHLKRRGMAAKLEAFITSKIPAENTSTASTSWVN